MSDARVRIVVVEDHALTRAGLRGVLATVGEFELVGEAADGIIGLELVLRESPDVAILDLGLPGRDGIDLTRAVKEALPQTGVVILTMADEDRNVRAALAAGADAYCVKASEPAILLDAVRAVASGGAYFDPRIARVALRLVADNDRAGARDADALTEREIAILQHVAEGRSNGEIAAAMHLGLGTIKGHLAEILGKLSASDRAQAAVIAFRRGYVR